MASSADNGNRNRASLLELGKARAKAIWQKVDEKTENRLLFRAGSWVFLVLFVTWLFNYVMCYLSGAHNFLKFLGGAAGISLLVYLLSLIFLRLSRPEKRPTYLIVLGITLIAITMLVQSFPGEPIGKKCCIWGLTREKDIITCRTNVVEVWFSNMGFIWGIATTLFGVAWRYFDEQRKEKKRREEQEKKEREERLRLEEWRYRKREHLEWRRQKSRAKLEKKREWNSTLSQQLAQINAETKQSPLHAAKLWIDICSRVKKKKKDLDDRNRGELTRTYNLNREKWVHAILMDIDWILIRDRRPNHLKLNSKEVRENIALLFDVAEMDCNTVNGQDEKEDKNQDFEERSRWKFLLKLGWQYMDAEEKHTKKEGNEDSSWENVRKEIFWLWDTYDILAREWVIALIKGWIGAHSHQERKDELEKELRNLRNSRRLGRHSGLRNEFPDLALPLWYRITSPWEDFRLQKTNPNVDDWLGKKRNPFGMARAEWEPGLTKVFYDFPEVQALMEGRHMAWIWAPAGSGRTALARATYDRLIQKPQQFPLYLELNQPLPDPVPAHILDRLLAQLTSAWGAVLQKQDSPDSQEAPFNGPVAFLDLAGDEQRRAAYLFLWRFGSLKGVLFWLESLNIDWRHDKQGKALKTRLAYFLKEAPDRKILEEEYKITMAASRPVGLQATYVMIECHGEMPEHQARTLLRLAESLQAQNVYLKILAPAPPPEPCPEARLKWTEKSLHALLEKQDTDRMLDDGARKALIWFTCAQNNGSPRELMRLGNLALRLRAEREESGEYSPPPDAEGVLTKEDIEFAIERWQASESASENAC